MTARSHLLLGLAGWVLVARGRHLPPFEPSAALTCLGGALLPDLDHPASRLGRRVPAISAPLRALLGHRGATHSLLGVCVCVLLARMAHANGTALLALATGLGSHLLADALTPAGVPLFWPAGRRVGLPVCRTGGMGELVVVGVLLGLVWFGLTHLR